MGKNWNTGASGTLSTRKPFFTVRVTKHWHRLPREVVEPPPLKKLKYCLDMVLGDRLQLTLLQQRVSG